MTANENNQERAEAVYCTRCEGRGYAETGVDESPTTVCNKCNGTGLAATSTTPQAPTAEPLISKEWLAEKLAACHDDAIGASQPKRPCDTPPGCNAGNCLRCGEVKPTAEGQTNKINPSTALCVVCGLGRHTAAHRGLLTDENKGTALDHPFTICTGRQGLIDALYAAWHREPAGETLGAIGNAIQYMQSDADLAAHALEEVMQLGYTVKNGMLFPPEQGRAADGVVSDEQLMRVIVNACDSLHITRVHELGGKTRTIMEDAGLLEIARAVLAIHADHVPDAGKMIHEGGEG